MRVAAERPSSAASDIQITSAASYRPRECTDADREHLAELSKERGVNLRPRLTGIGCRIGIGFAAVNLSREFLGHWRGAGRIETVPELPDQFDALFSGQGVEGKHTRSHV